MLTQLLPISNDIKHYENDKKFIDKINKLISDISSTKNRDKQKIFAYNLMYLIYINENHINSSKFIKLKEIIKSKMIEFMLRHNIIEIYIIYENLFGYSDELEEIRNLFYETY